jgi:hypothetical protein
VCVGTHIPRSAILDISVWQAHLLSVPAGGDTGISLDEIQWLRSPEVQAFMAKGELPGKYTYEYVYFGGDTG